MNTVDIHQSMSGKKAIGCSNDYPYGIVQSSTSDMKTK